MPLMIVIEAFSKQPVAIDPELVGEVRSLEGKNRMGRTRITSKRSRRVAWEVCEHFAEVMSRLEAAAGTSPMTISSSLVLWAAARMNGPTASEPDGTKNQK